MRNFFATKENKGLIFILLWELIAGFTPLIIKGINYSLPNSLLLLARFSLASLLLSPIILSDKKLRKEFFTLPLKKTLALALTGIVSTGISSLLYVSAIRKIGAVQTAIIISLEVPIAIALASLFFDEKLSGRFLKIAGMVLAGFFLLTYQDGQTISSNPAFFLGAGGALIAALIWGSTTILGKFFLDHNISPVTLAWFRVTFGSVFSFIVSGFTLESLTAPFSNLHFSDWLGIGYLGVIVSGIGFILYNSALKRMAVKKIALLYMLHPMISALLGALSGETLALSQWMGASMILMGVAILLSFIGDQRPSKGSNYLFPRIFAVAKVAIASRFFSKSAGRDSGP